MQTMAPEGDCLKTTYVKTKNIYYCPRPPLLEAKYNFKHRGNHLTRSVNGLWN